MGCKSIQSITLTENETVYSLGGGTPDNACVVSPQALQGIATKLNKVRGSLYPDGLTANARATLQYQTSADGGQWGTPVALTSTMSASGGETGDWNEPAAGFERFIRFIVTVGNTSGTAVELARASVIIDFDVES